MATRTQARGAVVELLYAFESGNEEIKKIASSMLEEKKIKNNQLAFALSLFNGVLERINEIDALIEPHLKDWDFKRLGSMEKAILRLGAYEIGFTPTQNPIIINECIELGKLYAEPNTPKFLNAILDSLSKKLAQKPLNWGCFMPKFKKWCTNH